ncbi:endonuclease [Bifidobacterium aemilianum]|uniref:Endonuclease n=1 Tax=Bifidobacterium aemilianum TaxID=2493120 RepID=A0A366KA71_9BIFI|nr:endonuclease/exonuclease/phosphatase family protein [Bifidobacterium aemilianum]RBP98614.1 endonuclease [Bifidobacterium aemilianum]
MTKSVSRAGVVRGKGPQPRARTGKWRKTNGAKSSVAAFADKRPRRNQRNRLLGVLAALLTLVGLVSVLVRLLPADLQALPWLPDLVALTPWFLIPSVLALILALRAKRWFVALVAILCLSVQVYWQYPFFSAGQCLPQEAMEAVSQAKANHSDAYARVMTFNVYKGRADAKAIVALVREQRVEVLALQETTRPFIDRLEAAGIEDYLPYSQVSSADGRYGNGLWSATEMTKPADDDVDSRASLMPGGTIRFKEGQVSIRFVSVHTTSPSPGQWEAWRQSLDDLARLTSRTDRRYILMGDFNASNDHAPFRSVLADRFQDAALQSGHGLTLSWPADRVGVPAFAAIDHLILDRGITAGQLEMVRIAGSDHKALLGTIAVD